MADFSSSHLNSRTTAAAHEEYDRDVNSISPMTYDEYRDMRTPTPQAFQREPVPSKSGSGTTIPDFDRPGGLGLAPEDEALYEETDVQWKAVAKPMRLGRATVMCLIFNRMIGEFRVYCYTLVNWFLTRAQVLEYFVHQR